MPFPVRKQQDAAHTSSVTHLSPKADSTVLSRRDLFTLAGRDKNELKKTQIKPEQSLGSPAFVIAG